MSNLNEQQFAKYSGIKVPGKRWPGDSKIVPLPASMERHAPGEYQPTLPGMEKMLPGEHTHTNVVFKHPVEAERWSDNTGEEHLGDVPRSNWYHLTSLYNPQERSVRASALRPSQDWLDDNHLHEDPRKETVRDQGLTPKVEKIGSKSVIQDGHHRAARAILAGNKKIDVQRWGDK